MIDFLQIFVQSNGSETESTLDLVDRGAENNIPKE